MSRVLCLLVLSTVLIHKCHGKSKQLPSFIKQCSLSDGKTKECLRENMDLIRPHFKEVIPEFKLMPICPAKFPKIEVIVSNINLTTIDVTVFNACNYQVVDFDVDMEKNFMKLSIIFPKLTLTSHYYVSGRVLVLNLQGDGQLETVLENVTATATLKGNRFSKNGKTYLNYEERKLKLKLGGGHVQFDDIFKGNPELTANTNKILNENILQLFDELAPFIEDVVASFTLNSIMSIFKTYSLEELFIS